MKKLLPVIFLLATMVANAQWSQTNSYYLKGNLCAISSSPESICLLTETGLSMLRAADPVWRPLMTWSGGTTPQMAANDATIVIADGQSYSISHDGGTTWSQRTGPYMPEFLGIMGQIIVAIDQQSILNYSTDLGATWKQSTGGLNATMGVMAGIMGNDIFAIQSDGNGTESLYRCNYNGSGFSAWSVVKTFPQYVYHTDILTYDGVIYLASSQGILKSANKGSTWNYLSFSMVDIAELRCDSYYLYANKASGEGLWRYSFDTKQWSAMVSSQSGDTIAGSTAACNGQFYAMLFSWWGERIGFFRYQDNKWQSANALPIGDTDEGTHNVRYTGNVLFSSVADETVSGFDNTYTSADRGSTWLRCESELSWSVNDAFQSGANYLVAGSSGVGIVDVTANTITSSAGINGYETFTFAKFRNLLYAGTADGIYSSANDGTSWSYKFLKGKIVYKLKVCSDTLYAGTDQGLFFTTEGTTWGNTTCLISGIRDIAATSKDIFATSSVGLLKKVDSLNAWLPVGTALIGIDVNVIIARSSRLYAGTAHGTVLYTDDGGDTWMDISNAGFKNITGFDFAGDDLFVSEKSSGVWWYPAGWPGGISRGGEKPALSLFPNPASDNLTILFPENFRGRSTIEIMNMTGAVTRTIHAAAMPGGRVTMDVADLPAGLYMVNLRNREQTISAKFSITLR
jgi:hypothetical protein